MGKEVRTYALTVAVDPEAYAREYGFSVASARTVAWESAEATILALEDATVGGWLEAEQIARPVDLIARFDEIQAQRESNANLIEELDNGSARDAERRQDMLDAWDRDEADICHELVKLLRPAVGDTAPARPIEDGPQKMTDRATPDHWQGYTNEESFRFSVIWTNDQVIYNAVKKFAQEWREHPDHDADDTNALGEAVVKYCEVLDGFESLNGYNWDLIDPQEVGQEVLDVLEV